MRTLLLPLSTPVSYFLPSCTTCLEQPPHDHRPSSRCLHLPQMWPASSSDWVLFMICQLSRARSGYFAAPSKKTPPKPCRAVGAAKQKNKIKTVEGGRSQGANFRCHLFGGSRLPPLAALASGTPCVADVPRAVECMPRLAEGKGEGAGERERRGAARASFCRGARQSAPPAALPARRAPQRSRLQVN